VIHTVIDTTEEAEYTEGRPVKQAICVLLVSALVANGQTAQTPGKGVKRVTATGTATSPSNRDLNIQVYVRLLRTDLNKKKSQIIDAVMQLDVEQAAAFWPIYKDFESGLNEIGDQITDLVKDYVASYYFMTDDVADKLATQLLDIEEQRNGLKRKYYEKFNAALGPITAVRFLQVENQIERLCDLQIASQLPVAGESGR
jgi:hypothetical protein